jgi:tetratricopeptide (TPR) repeat protein
LASKPFPERLILQVDIMTQELTSIRRTLTMVPSDVKQNKLLPAANAIQAAARALIRLPLLKNEQDELVKQVSDACDLLQDNKELRKIFPLAITYVPKHEQALVDILGELISTLESEAASQAQDGMSALLERQKSTLEKGKTQLEAGEHDAARKTFAAVTKEFSKDDKLHVEVGEAFMQVGLFADAEQYLTKAEKIAPNSAHVLNRLGIALRRLGRFDAAEARFRKAISLEGHDPNLHFNLGRLYLDWEKWQECALCGQAALDIEPSFTQASQMLAYCARKLKDS